MRNIQQWMVLGLLVLMAGSLSMAQSPQSAAPPSFIGTWKFNPEKSKMNLSLPPRSLTRKYEDRGGGVYIFTQEGISADGQKMFSLYVAKDDGAQYPLVIQGADNLSNISIKRIDANTYEQIENANANGGGGTRAVRSVSPDGKTLTLTIRPAQGGGGQGGQRGNAPPEPVDPNEVNIMVFDRQ
jgi:hypothetical protein